MEAIYRLFSSDAVTMDRILDAHRESTIRRAAEHQTVLVPQDTTELDFSRPRERVGGRLNSSTRRGLLAHVLLALGTDGVPLGVVGTKVWARPTQKSAKPMWQLPLAKKESVRWLEGFAAICDFKAQLPPQTRVIAISDSEGDIYECLSAPATQREGMAAQFIVRASSDRRVDGGSLLHEEMLRAPQIGAMTVLVTPQRAASFDGRRRKMAKERRDATVEIRARRITVQAPVDRRTSPPSCDLNAILVREVDPPTDTEPIEWLLLTDLPIDSHDQILEVIEFYTRRWQIEIYFRVLKSGCAVEELQLETDERLRPCLALYMIIAWRLLHLTMLGRAYPEMSADAVLERAEWQAAYALATRKQPPSKPPTLSVILPMIARLGGFLARSCDGAPGPKQMWIGLQRLRDIAIGWELPRPSREPDEPKRRKRSVER
jgi:hypothetical protein